MNLKIYTDNIEETAKNQILELLAQDAFKDAKVRIMPDVHAGAGCVIGFTADLGDKVIPNVVGVDIGCGMRVVQLGKVEIDLAAFDKMVKDNVPAGRNAHEKTIRDFDITGLYCYEKLHDIGRIPASIGTLGGGNHFIEIDEDEFGLKYLVIHTGSRNLGKQVADIYQKMAINIHKKPNKDEIARIIRELKSQGRAGEIETALKSIPPASPIPDDLAYLSGELREQYLHDMRLCQKYAIVNRKTIAGIILESMGLRRACPDFESVHNYIGDDNIVRKGAISARAGEIVIIPINMRDGCIIGKGLGNEEWNYSAPHGAGRIMSRMKAREILSVDAFRGDMAGIYTTTANESTIDESPRAYKPMEEIIANIKETVEITDIIKPIYNFKAEE